MQTVVGISYREMASKIPKISCKKCCVDVLAASHFSMFTLIFDTNVVLDWLVFDDPLFVEFTNVVQAGSVNLLTHAAALDELRRVLNYPALKFGATRQEQVYATYQSLCHEAVVPDGFTARNLLTPIGFPICRDRDDQLFLALALHTKANALVSRDKAVLSMRKKASKFGVTILDVKQMREEIDAWRE